jgi:Uncharacterized protein conserved in bacteria
MAYFAVIAFDKPDSAALREKLRAEHRAYGFANDQKTRIAGALYGDDGTQIGTLKIFEAETAEEVWDWYRKEPFYLAGLYADFKIIEWNLAFNRFEKKDWNLSAPGRLPR